MSGPLEQGLRPDIVSVHSHGFGDLPVGSGVGRIFTAPIFQFQAVPTTPNPSIANPTAFAVMPEMDTTLSPVPFDLPPLPAWLPRGWRCDVHFDGLFEMDVVADDPGTLPVVFCSVDGASDLMTYRTLGRVGSSNNFGTLAFHKTYRLNPGPHNIRVGWINLLPTAVLTNGTVGAPLARCFTVDVFGC